MLTVTVAGGGVNALLKGMLPGVGVVGSLLPTLVNAIATPPTATRARAAAIPNTDSGNRCQGRESSGGGVAGGPYLDGGGATTSVT